MGVHTWRAGTVQRGAKHRSSERLILPPPPFSLAQTPHPSLSWSHVRVSEMMLILLLFFSGFFLAFSLFVQFTGIVPDFLQDFSGAALGEERTF